MNECKRVGRRGEGGQGERGQEARGQPVGGRDGACPSVIETFPPLGDGQVG